MLDGFGFLLALHWRLTLLWLVNLHGRLVWAIDVGNWYWRLVWAIGIGDWYCRLILSNGLALWISVAGVVLWLCTGCARAVQWLCSGSAVALHGFEFAVNLIYIQLASH